MCLTKAWSRYLLWFAHEHVEFRNAEMQSILAMLNIPIKFIEETSIDKPYWIVELPSEESAKKIAARSVALKNCIELWSSAKSVIDLHSNLKKSLNNHTGNWIVPNNEESEVSDAYICPVSLIEPCCVHSKSYKVEVETFCKHFTLKEKVNKIEAFSYLPLEGPVNLKYPDVTLSYIEFYGIDPNKIPEKPYDVFFGRWVADGQRDLILHHSLKKRKFIGNTSMDAQLALLMANQAQIKRGDLVLDPFVGSGSLLVAAGHFEAYVWGSDIDYMMVHGRTKPTRVGQKVRAKEESIQGNMRQYNIGSQYLDVIVSDFSMPLWRADLKFDAIVTDPPYGVREPTEKIGIERDNYTLADEHRANHIPSKVDYDLPHMYQDLLNFAAKHLNVSRRLVCWFPIVRKDYKEEDLPSHPCLKLVANSEQVLSRLTSRRLLTYEKIGDLDENGGGSVVGHNFREKYFGLGEMSRKERKEKQNAEMAAYFMNKAKTIKDSVNSNNVT